MLQERHSLHIYFPPQAETQTNKTSIIDRAAQQARLGFNAALLPQLKEMRGIKLSEDNGYRSYATGAGIIGPNLLLKMEDLTNESVMPVILQQTTSPILVYPDRRWYPARNNSEVTYTLFRTGKPHDRLEQTVSLRDLSSDFDPDIRIAKVRHLVHPFYGEMTYGEVSLQAANSERTQNAQSAINALGISAGNDPVFLVFIPDKVLATTYGPGPEVLAELTYEQLENAGVKAEFQDKPENASLELQSTFGHPIKITLEKFVKSDYPLLLFSRPSASITDSTVALAD